MKRAKKKNACAILAALVFLSFSATALAEEFSLEGVILYAFRNNKDIQIQERSLSVARANIVDARSKFLPHLDFEYSYTRNDKVFAENIFTGFKNDNLALLSLSESIYNGGANIANFRQAQLGLKVQEETLRAKRLDVEFEAKRLYYGLLLAIETERISKELVSQAKDHYKNVEDKFNHGTASRFDLLQSKVQVSLLMPQLVNAENDIEYIKAQLNKLLGRKVSEPVGVKEKLAFSSVKIQEEEDLKTAYMNKPEIILQQLGVDISKWSIMMAKSGYRPDINARAEYYNRSDNTGHMFNEKHRNWNAGVSVTLPVFEGFSTRAKVDSAKAQYAQALLSKDNLYDQTAVDIRKGCLDLKQAETIINSQKDNVAEAEEALRIAEVSYNSGVAINLDVLDAQVSLAQIQNNLAQGIFDYLMAEAFLDRNTAKSYVKEEGNEKIKPG